MKKNKIFWHGDTLMRQVSNLNLPNINVLDPTKDDIAQPLTIKEILVESEIYKNDYCRTSAISKDKDFELYLEQQTNFYFLKKLNFDVGLKAWEANINIQVQGSWIYVSIFLKNWRSLFISHEASNQGILWEHHASIQEAVYHILPELKLWRNSCSSRFYAWTLIF